MSDSIPGREELQQSIDALEAQREVLGDAVGPAIAALRAQLASLTAELEATEDQRKQITVLFADVKGFTNMSQTMDPEDVAEVMNSLWASLDQVIEDHGGRVDKHIGDAVMALFGAPAAREDDPERAVVAGLEMQKIIRKFVESNGPEVSALQMRVGINTGLAMLGNVGSNNEYTAIGHTVNLASRLEGLAAPGSVLISQATMNHVVGLFNVESTAPLDVKGVEAPVQAYMVKTAKPRTYRVGPREVAGIQTRMVGRDDEMALLRSLLPPSPDDPPRPTRLVTIIGDPGVGKSRIVYEYFNYLEGNPHPVWLFRGRAVESSRDAPYSVLRSILADRFLIADSDSPEEAKSKLEGGLAEYIGNGAGKVAPLLGHLIGLDYRDDPIISDLLSEPKVIRDKGFKAFANLLATGRPEAFRVCLIEDIHWSDEESLDLIEFLAGELATTPLVIMCTARPDILAFRPAWTDESDNRATIQLERLDADATDALITDVLQRLAEAPAELRDLIKQRSEGNPFFLEELVKMLIDEGVIVVSGDEWKVHLDALSKTEIPGTLTGVLQARLDSLPRPERMVLQRSSVIGRVFWEEAADHLAASTSPDGSIDPLRVVAPSLKSHELAYERDPSAFEFTREFIFKHAILHDVAYESVVRKIRRVYHHEVAEWLIGAAGDRDEEFAGQIAEHYDRAGDNAEALEWLVKAGDRARSSHAPEAAARAYKRAIELASATEADRLSKGRIAALGGLGDVLTMQAQYQKAIAVYKELASASREASDHEALARAELGLATAETYRGRPQQALEAAVRSREAAERAGVRRAQAKAKFVEAWSNIRLGSFEPGVRIAGEMLAITEEIGDKTLLAEALNLQGVIAASTGSYEDAVENFGGAADLYEQTGNEEKRMPILNNLGVIAELTGDYADAEKRYAEALEMAKETSDRDAELVYSSNLGGAMVAQGRSRDGEILLRSVIELAPGEFSLLSETYRFLARALHDQNLTDEAEGAALASLNLAVESGAPDHLAGAWRMLGSIASKAGRAVNVAIGEDTLTFTADQLFERSLEVARSMESDADAAKALAAWAIHDVANGNDGDGMVRWHEARDLLQGLGAQLEIERTEKILNSLGTAVT